jgi:cytochrome c2
MRRSGSPGLFVWQGLLVWTAFVLLLVLGACNSSEEPADPLVAEGKRVFKKNCTSCHSLRPDLTVTGPSLYGNASRAGERMAGQDATQYHRLSITAPGDFLV